MVGRGAVSAQWRDRLDRALESRDGRSTSPDPGAAAGSGSGTGTGERDEPAAPARDWVGAHMAAATCPAGAFVPEDEFRETPMTAARSIALTTLRRADPGSWTPVDRVRLTISEPGSLRMSLAVWLGEIDRAASSAVVAAATGWMVDALALGARHGEPQWHDPTNLAHGPAGTGVKLAAGIDATRRADGGAAIGATGTNLLVIRLRPASTDARLSRRVALLSAVCEGEVPESVVLGHREPRRWDRHGIDEEAMVLALSEAGEDVARATRPSTAPVRPGPPCRYCPLIDRCPEGADHLDSSSGAPFPSGVRQSAFGADPTT